MPRFHFRSRQTKSPNRRHRQGRFPILRWLAFALPALVSTGRPVGIEAEPSSKTPTVTLAPFVVTAERDLAAESTDSYQRITLSLLDLDSESPLSLDALLKKDPVVSTYRRTSGLTAHPTTQGVRMHNAATNATSRSLVLLDGIPQNDPFGGWVQWNRLPLRSTETIRLYTNGEQGAWGNLSAGGVISLSEPSAFDGHGHFVAQVGSLDTINVSAGGSFLLGEATALNLSGTAFTTAGFIPVAADQRGPIDEEAWSRYATLGAGLEHVIRDELVVSLNLGFFDEERGNGTPGSTNDSQGVDLSLQIEQKAGPDAGWQSTIFHQERDFSNIFTSVNDDRTDERPVLDQYDVPATSTGLSFTWSNQSDPDRGWLAGADVRTVVGTVNERYRNLGQGFTRDRSAGGEQLFAGLFTSFRFRPAKPTTIEATLRLDRWQQTNGFRDERNLETGERITTLSYPDQSGWEPTIGLSATHELSDAWTTRLNLSRGFRAPTLNELYRPFRVGNDITESNPELDPETSLGLDWSVVFEKTPALKVRFGFFGYRLTDMITNVLQGYGPGFDPLCGFVPEGGSCSQRENVAESRVWGGELQIEAALTSSVNIQFHSVLANTEFRSDAGLESLEGNAFPHAPDHRLSGSLDWAITESIDAMARLNYSSTEYEDALNNRRLASSTTVDLAVDYRWPATLWSIGLAIDNLLDTRIEAGIATSGLITMAEPRMIRLTARYRL